MALRYYVERPKQSTEDVGADSYTLHPSGALVFDIGNGEQLIYAPGEWVTMVSEVEA